MSTLFSPFSLGPLTLANRIVVAPMCQYSAVDGQATEWHGMHLGHLAVSGAGLLITEATAVEAVGRTSPQDLGLWSDSTEEALGTVLRAVHKHSPVRMAIQLGHAGRKASCRPPWEGGDRVLPAEGGWQPFAPSMPPYRSGDAASLELDAMGIDRIISAFAAAASRAARLGFDAIEVHAAHGYLLHQFLSPLANFRTDEYGGEIANRMRFPLAVFDAVRQSVPTSMAVGIRISATDWVEGGWDLEQSVIFANKLAELHCDFIHVSTGGLSPQQKIVPESGYQVPFARRIKNETGLPTIAVGMITDAEMANDIVTTGDADMVALARAMLFNPRWPWHAAAKLGAIVDAPMQYWKSTPRDHPDLFGDTNRLLR